MSAYFSVGLRRSLVKVYVRARVYERRSLVSLEASSEASACVGDRLTPPTLVYCTYSIRTISCTSISQINFVFVNHVCS